MRILVTGASGMLGNAIFTELLKFHPKQFVLGPSREELDLLDIGSVIEYLNEFNFDLIIHCAALVGGIAANIEKPFEYLNSNIRMDSNLMKAAHRKRVHNFMYMASSCMYPATVSQPMKEAKLLTGPLEKTNEGYALAKLVGTKTVEVVAKELNWRAFILSNMYGPGDKYELSNSHLIAGVIKKVYLAKVNNLSSVEMWGSGHVRREFTYVEDVAKFLVRIRENLEQMPPIMNLGNGKDYAILDFYKFVCKEMDFTGEIVANRNKPEGMAHKLMDSSVATRHGWRPETDIQVGIHESVKDFIARYQEHYEK
jgi:GDP-L-fucose synthase